MRTGIDTWTLANWQEYARTLELNKQIHNLHYEDYTPKTAHKEMPKGWGDPMDVDAQRYTPKRRVVNSKRPNKPRPKFTGKCNICHKIGHKAAQCYKKKKPLAAKEQQWESDTYGGSEVDQEDTEDFPSPTLEN